MTRRADAPFDLHYIVEQLDKHCAAIHALEAAAWNAFFAEQHIPIKLEVKNPLPDLTWPAILNGLAQWIENLQHYREDIPPEFAPPEGPADWLTLGVQDLPNRSVKFWRETVLAPWQSRFDIVTNYLAKLRAGIPKPMPQGAPGAPLKYPRSAAYAVRSRRSSRRPIWRALYDDCRSRFPEEFRAKNDVEVDMELENWKKAVRRLERRPPGNN